MATGLGAGGIAVLLPAVALACPVCFISREASRLAFMWTAVVLSLLPLGMIGGLCYWLWRRARDGVAAEGRDEGPTS